MNEGIINESDFAKTRGLKTQTLRRYLKLGKNPPKPLVGKYFKHLELIQFFNEFDVVRAKKIDKRKKVNKK